MAPFLTEVTYTQSVDVERSLVSAFGEARHEVLAAKHDGSHTRGCPSQVGKVQKCLGDFDEQMDVKVTTGQSEGLLFFGQQLVKGFDFVDLAYHGQDEAAD